MTATITKMQHRKSMDEYDHTCTSIENCAYLQRICKALQFYQLEINHNALLKYFDPENYDLLLLDYHHILDQHLNNKPMMEIKKEFELIHNKIMQYIHVCSLEKCIKLQRNHRKREKENINDEINGIDHDNNAQIQFYIDTMDTIHCYFVHSFDIGFRLKSNEIDKLQCNDDNKNEQKNDDNDNKDDSYLYKDNQMKQLKNILNSKRKRLENIRGINRMQHNKFLTKMEEDEQKEIIDDQQDNDNNDKKDAIYSFGHKYYYWEYYKTNDQKELNGPNEGYKYKFWYIPPKHKSLKDELLHNKILTISKTQYKNILHRATQNLQSKHCRKTMIASGDLLNKYDISSDSTIKLENIITIILYCDYDKLSYEFSKTFRKINRNESNESLKIRNSEFWNWSKILRETVECYGTYIMDSKINIFYHGVSYLLLNSFVSYFCGPTSTTSQICVATTFAKKDGLILELAMDDGRLTFFNCSWLSCYGNEDERLFFGGYKPLRFASIRLLKTNENYKLFIKAFVLFNYVITSDYPLEQEIDKRDYKIIKKLIKYKNMNNKFPKYVMDIWNAFCLNKKLIKIRIEYLHKYYDGFIPLLLNKECSNLVMIYDLCILFPNCTKIVIDFAATYDVRDNNMNDKFISELFCILEEINEEIEKEETKLRTIQFKYIKYQNLDLKQEFLDRFTKQFKPHGWNIVIHGFKGKDLLINKA